MDTYSKKFQPVICAPWTPTDAAFERYLAREVEMARRNIANGGGELHSERTRVMARHHNVIANISVRTRIDGRWIGQS